jgi:hypothetical protein
MYYRHYVLYTPCIHFFTRLCVACRVLAYCIPPLHVCRLLDWPEEGFELGLELGILSSYFHCNIHFSASCVLSYVAHLSITNYCIDCSFVDHPEYKTIIVIEGSDEVLVDIAVNSLLNRLPTNAVLRVERGVSKSESIKSCKR